jgi:hypothetical protein
LLHDLNLEHDPRKVSAWQYGCLVQIRLVVDLVAVRGEFGASFLERFVLLLLLGLHPRGVIVSTGHVSLPGCSGPSQPADGGRWWPISADGGRGVEDALPLQIATDQHEE